MNKDVISTCESFNNSSQSRIFSLFKTAGLVSNDIPCLTRYIHRRRQNFIITCVGKSFNTYSSQKLQLLTSSGSMPHDITYMCVDTYHVYTACKNLIYAWRRGFELKHIYEYESNVNSILSFPPNLISLYDDGALLNWDIAEGTYKTINNLKSFTFIPTIMMHPATYINKILVGSLQGVMILLNTRTGLIIHHFTKFSSKIHQMIQTPEVDVVALSFENKKIVLHNIRFDEIVMTLKCIEPQISLAFRLDGPPILISGSREGVISLWNLEKQELVSRIENSHAGAVTGLQVFPQEPIFVTSSSDNSIKVWIFDMPDGSFRLLNSRDGHYESSNKLRFFGKGTDSKYILSSSLDGTLRMFHIYNETYNRSIYKITLPYEHKITKVNNLSSKKRAFKMTPIIDFTPQSVSCPKHHPDLAAIHKNSFAVSTWSFANTKIGDNVIFPKEESQNLIATCIAMSSCCQFVIVGYSNGSILKFNIQSGQFRKSFCETNGQLAHNGSKGPISVTGLAIDLGSKLLMSGATEGELKFWDFKNGKLDGTLSPPGGVKSIFHQPNNYFAGVIVSNSILLVVNLAAKLLFRAFTVSAPIVTGVFSPDNRWLTVSTSDSILRTWDLATSNLIDAFRLDFQVTTLDYSPTGEHLAGNSSSGNGIYIWANKSMYESTSLMPLPSDYVPPLFSFDSHPQIHEDMDTQEEYVSPEQIKSELLTLSLLSESRWKNLLNLDTIRMRNKPKEPAKKYEVPFFLPGILNSDVPLDEKNDKLNATNDTGTKVDVNQSKIYTPLSPFGQSLNELDFEKDSEVDELCKMLAGMGPSKIDGEIRSISLSGENYIRLMIQFIKFSSGVCRTRKNFENGQAYLALFLKIHGVAIRENEEVCKELEVFRKLLPGGSIEEQINRITSYSHFLMSKLF